MSEIKNSFLDLVGNTPIVRVNNLIKKDELKADVLAKLEYFNPAGSVKDRIAKEMILDALEKGLINENTTLIEPTSGNTGIGLSAVATALNLKIIITMPETMSVERRNLMKAYGAELVLTPGSEGMKGAIAKAKELASQIENSFIPGQFENPANPTAHYKTTGPEIYEQTEGKVDIFVAGVGTGGTISGIGKYLKEKNPEVKVVAVEPASSPVLSTGKGGAHKIQGIGAGFVPETLDTKIYDEIITVENEDAFATGKEMAKTEGILIGISSGAAIQAAKELAKREEKLKKKESKKLSGKTNSFDDMIAYVDENGMITSTPPADDIQKEEINPDEIVIATPKKEEEEPVILRGRVEFFNVAKGFGFIKDLNGVEKYFFHVNNVVGNIVENNIVTFDLERGTKGMNAVNICLEKQ